LGHLVKSDVEVSVERGLYRVIYQNLLLPALLLQIRNAGTMRGRGAADAVWTLTKNVSLLWVGN
jgi:hypothetical protein